MAASPVAAECTGATDPWPSFRAAAGSARQIVVGEVLSPGLGPSGYMASFKIRVIDVLRGPPARETMEFVGLTSGLPLTICADMVALLLPGDVVAFALDAVAPDGATRINTLAYLAKAGDSLLTGVEAITPAELETLVPRPDRSGSSSGLKWLGFGVGGLLLLVLGIWVVHRARRG